MFKLRNHLIASIVLLVVVGCQPKNPSEEIPQTIDLTTVKPTLEPLEGYPWEQTKDNVTITIAPEPIEPSCVYQRSLKGVYELFKSADANPLYKVTDTPSRLELSPDHLILKLNTTNNLSHVLRFHGAVPTLTIDGKAIPISEQTKNELIRAVLTPYTTLDLTIDGPSLSTLESASTLNFAIYDVITAVDEANNPTKRTTFEWIFSVRPTEISKSFTVRKLKERYGDAQAARMNNSFVK